MSLSVDYASLVRSVARQLGYGSVYSTGTVEATASTKTIKLTGGVWPAWAGDAAINIEGTVYGITSRKDEDEIKVDSIGDLSSGKKYVLVQSITDDKADTFLDIQDVIDQGYREFCFPAPAQEPYFVWSWLLEKKAIDLKHNTSEYVLGSDFGQYVDNSVVYKSGIDEPPLSLISEREFRAEQSRDEGKGVPRYVTWRQKAFASATGREFELFVYPTPESASFPGETLTGGTPGNNLIEYYMRVVPAALSPDAPFPLCGDIHGDTLLKSCQAVAERKLGDDAGIYEGKFKERLAASMAVDRAVKATIGV